MNPHTLIRLSEAFTDPNKPMHILAIGGITGTWPATVYRAMAHGYLIRTDKAYFIPTYKFWREVNKALYLRSKIRQERV